MKIILATGIYPPAIGGPATYSHALARELHALGHTVTVVTYAHADERGPVPTTEWTVRRVSNSGGPISRWRRYATTLKEVGKDADVIYAFSSVSAGVPLFLSRLLRPKRILRLGGDFLWERYTDLSGGKSLREWYEESRLAILFMGMLLSRFHHIVFSTRFQQEIYERHYNLPPHSVIENALTFPKVERVSDRAAHDPFRLLFIGRFVGFKNLASLIRAMASLPGTTLTLIGQGPLEAKLRGLVTSLNLDHQVSFRKPVHGKEKREVFSEHDLLVLPSLTEISPNTALEAKAALLPVLLTSETGLSHALAEGMMLRNLRTPTDIAQAVEEVMSVYPFSIPPIVERSWAEVASEHLKLFSSLL